MVELVLDNNRIQSLNLFDDGHMPYLNQYGTTLHKLAAQVIYYSELMRVTCFLQGNPLVCDCRMKWLSTWIAYNTANNAKHWLDVRDALVWSRCIDRPGGADNLLNIYDTSAREYAAYQRREQEQQKPHAKPLCITTASPPLECSHRAQTGFAAFFSSAGIRSAPSSRCCVHILIIFELIIFAVVNT